MKITANHMLDDALSALIPGGGNMPVRRLLVIHFTEGATARSSIEYWRTPKCRKDDICAHLVIDRDGEIYQCRPFNRTASHAGASRWRDPSTGDRRGSANTYAIGIELANAGSSPAVLSWARKQPGFASMRARHRNGGAVKEWEAYPAAQLAACTEVSRALVAHYRLDDITGHDCIAPERKEDPGPAFPMQALREACGFQGLPTVFQP